MPTRITPETNPLRDAPRDRKSTRLNSSHGYISYAVFCLKKNKRRELTRAPRQPQGAADCALLAARDATQVIPLTVPLLPARPVMPALEQPPLTLATAPS